MILEGIVTTLDRNNGLNVAPMGPIVDAAFTSLLLRPFRTSRTYQNLKERPCGVFHVVDDVLLLARAAIGELRELPETFPAERVTGRVLSAACRWFEFEIDACDDAQERTEMRARVVHAGRLRDFFGFNRAKHAVLEAAILATRVHLIAPEKVHEEFERLQVIVQKTAGPGEREAFELLEQYVGAAAAKGNRNAEGSRQAAEPASREIVVTTGARLHFGLLAHGQKSRRQFGGVGTMIDRPGFVVRANTASVDELQCGSWQPRVAELLTRLRAFDRPGAVSPSLRLEIMQSPPSHAGLGSGTQLGMALAKICSILTGQNETPVAELARRTGRGLRSAVGLYGFQYGGLLVEAGKLAADEISPLVARTELPAEWRFVLVRPRGATGISGTDEVGGFARLPPMAENLTNRLCRIALTELLPAAADRDFPAAGNAIGEFGRLVGEYFAPIQGGVLADEQMRRLAEKLTARGLRGMGQTSWGPTLFILSPDAASAQGLADDLQREPDAANCEITIAAPLNRGATVELK
jgi:beta-RFAP synthase